MKKMYGLISKVLIVIMVVMQITSLNGMTRVSAANSKRLSYVIVNGGYFDTGIKINQDYSIEMVFSVSDVNQYKNYYESMVNTQRAFRLRQEAGKGLYAAYGWYNGNVYTMKANEELTVAQKKNITYINNIQVQKATLQEFQATTNLKFGDFKGYIKSFRIWNESNTLVANYTPAEDGSGRACMYDMVRGKYVYYTGQCQAGGRVEEETKEESSTEIQEEKKEVIENNTSSDILESVGSSLNNNISYVDAIEVKGGRFDSGFKVDLNYSLEAVFSLANLSQYKNIYEATYNNSKVFRLRNESTNGLRVAYGWYDGKNLYQPAIDEEITVLQKKNITYINGKQVQKATVQTLESDSTLKFGDFSGKLVSFRIWDGNNKLIAEFLPATDNNDKACLYDMVNKEYVYYSGTCTAIVEEIEDDVILEDVVVDKLPSYGATVPSIRNEETFKRELLALLIAGDTNSHDFSEYGYHWQKVSDLFNEVVENEGRIAYASCANMYYTTTKDSAGCVITLKLENVDDGYLKRYQSTKAIVDKLVAQSEGMTELEKTILAHDYVVSHCSYQLGDLLHYTAGSALADGKAVCSGYAKAMILLLLEMGMESELVRSPEMNHAWVKVKVNGNWYHADPTWDDTRSSITGRVSHEFLLRTDAEFLAGGKNRHYGWEGTVSTDTSYTNWKVHDIVGELCYENGTWYYVNASGKKVTVDIR